MNRKAGGYGWDDSLILGAWVCPTLPTWVLRNADGRGSFAQQVLLLLESGVRISNTPFAVENSY